MICGLQFSFEIFSYLAMYNIIFRRLFLTVGERKW